MKYADDIYNLKIDLREEIIDQNDNSLYIF